MERVADAGALRPVRWWSAAIAGGLMALAGCSSGPSGSGSGDGLFTTESGAGGGGQGGDVVAVLELAAPTRASFVLHGTIPVPPRTFPRPDGLLPFSVRNVDGSVVPTQVELVSRYPQDADGADVVEVLARVDRPTSVQPGTPISYEVVLDPHPSALLPIKKHVLDLISQPGAVLVAARDCFGNEYAMDLFKDVRRATGHSKVLRKGQAAVQVRNYGVMRPTGPDIGPPSGALKHFLGVHGYVTAWARDDALSLDLRINNGPSGYDKSSPVDDPLGKVYFETVELWVPNGWTVQLDVEDPFFGDPRPEGNWTAYPLVEPLSDGSLHVMGERAQFHRRLALAKTGQEADARALLDEEGQAFARRGVSPSTGQPLYSWWNPQTARYFPTRQKLPDLSYLGAHNVKGNLKNSFLTLRNHLQGNTAGTFPLQTAQLGWARPWGVAYGGMTGGTEIFIYDGMKVAEAASNEGYRAAQLTHRMYSERQPMALYDKNGETTTPEQWVVHGPQFDYLPMAFFLKLLPGNDPFGYDKAQTYQMDWVASAGKQPFYETQLLKYDPIDFQHFTRYTRSPKVLAWLGNDALSKDDLRMAAENFRLSYVNMPNGANGYAVPSGMLHDTQSVDKNPGVGFAFGRGEGWGIDVVSAAYSVSDPTWRARVLPWAQEVSDLVTNGQSSCNGFIQSVVSAKMLNGQFRVRQSIEQAIVENALVGLCASVLEGVDPARTAQTRHVIDQSTHAMIGPLAWSSSMNGPWSYLAVAPLNGIPYCSTLPPGGGGNGADKYQNWSSFAYGHQVSGDTAFLQCALDMAGGGGNLLTAMQNMGFNNLENRSALIAHLQ